MLSGRVGETSLRECAALNESERGREITLQATTASLLVAIVTGPGISC